MAGESHFERRASPEERTGLLEQACHRFVQDGPYDPIVDGCITMYEPIPQADNSSHIFDPVRRIGIPVDELIERLADDLELAFDGTPELAIGRILIERPPRTPFVKDCARIYYISEQFCGFRPHRKAAG
jgi:hypothetical protein